MGIIFGFIRFIFKVSLLLAGTLAVVMLVGAMYSSSNPSYSSGTVTNITNFQAYADQPVGNIPPGWRREQIAEYLNATGKVDGNRFLNLTASGTVVNHPLLADRPAGASYEGYLLPGNYDLDVINTPEALVAQMLTNMAAQLPPNAVDLARQQGLTFYETLIVASIVERETLLASEKPVVASVYLNRLNPAYGEPYLNADPTVQYAMGYQPASGQWWKSPVTLDEYQGVDSPYNTYLYPGLPPGPIANPSIGSIMAVLQPANTDYLFFVCRHQNCKGGEHTFATTYQEHLQNVSNYYGQ